MDVRVTPIHRLLTIHKSAVISIFLHFVHGRYRTARSWDWEWVGIVKWNGPFRSNRSNREKWSTSKGGPLFSKLFRLDRTDPYRFKPKFPEILDEWIAPYMYLRYFSVNFERLYIWFGKPFTLFVVLFSLPQNQYLRWTHAQIIKR